MKASAVWAISVALVSILLCPLVMAAPPMPDDVQMVEPDPSLPKELAAFWGKWEGRGVYESYFLIVEKIDLEKVRAYGWRSGYSRWGIPEGWQRNECNVIKEYGKYKVWRRFSFGSGGGLIEWTLKGEYLYISSPMGEVRYTRVP